MFNPKEYSVSIPSTGSGLAGAGSIAVAAYFSASTSSGLGAFSGDLRIPIHNPEHVEGIFTLTDGSPATLPPLSCGPLGEVGASGTVTFGSFKGNHVTLASCIGPSSVDYWRVDLSIDYVGQGIGAVVVSGRPILAGSVMAANTVGAGSAGARSVNAAQVLALASDGTILAGGAFVGTTSDINPGNNNWTINRASIQPGCTLTTQGVTSSTGSFPNQRVTTSETPTGCPPANLSPQPVTVTFVVGSVTNPIYAGHGSGTVMAAIQNTR